MNTYAVEVYQKKRKNQDTMFAGLLLAFFVLSFFLAPLAKFIELNLFCDEFLVLA